mgnify:CR=1 FL=1|jgi:hypothetical protein
MKMFITGGKKAGADIETERVLHQGTQKHVKVNRNELKNNLIEIDEKEAALLLQLRRTLA